MSVLFFLYVFIYSLNTAFRVMVESGYSARHKKPCSPFLHNLICIVLKCVYNPNCKCITELILAFAKFAKTVHVKNNNIKGYD